MPLPAPAKKVYAFPEFPRWEIQECGLHLRDTSEVLLHLGFVSDIVSTQYDTNTTCEKHCKKMKIFLSSRYEGRLAKRKPDGQRPFAICKEIVRSLVRAP